MRLTCPHCGPRGLEEFSYRGDATVRRLSLEAPEEDWIAYVYLRDNPCGAHKELWYHGSGCRAWLVVERNTLTHAVHSVNAVSVEDAP